MILDAGDMLFATPVLPEAQGREFALRSALLFDANRRIGLDAVEPGDLDFLLGKDYLLARATETTILSSNILDPSTHAPLFVPTLVKEISGVRVGVFGLLDPSLNLGPAQGAVEIEDITVSARKAVAALKADKADLIVALTHLGLPLDEILAKNVEGIDIIIGAHSGVKLDKPTRMGKTIICQAFQRGQYLGRLDLTLVGAPPYTLADASEGTRPPRGASTYANTLVALDTHIKSDPAIDAIVSSYKDTVEAIQREQAAQVQSATAAGYRGEEACRKCHVQIAAFQGSTRHARAFDILVTRQKALDPQCLPCHTTGFRRPGGFDLPSMAGNLKNVQCEDCHGPAKNHPDNPLVSKPFTPVEKETCTACHTRQWDPAFDYARKLPKVSCTGAFAKTVH